MEEGNDVIITKRISFLKRNSCGSGNMIGE